MSKSEKMGEDMIDLLRNLLSGQLTADSLKKFLLIFVMSVFVLVIATTIPLFYGAPSSLGLVVIFGFVIWGLIFYVLASIARSIYDKLLLRRRISHYEDEVTKNPESARPAWDLASARLEQYVIRNLSHVSWIFVLILIVMTVGFVIIGCGVYHAINSGEVASSVVATSSGIIVEFIAATFLLIYKSTMKQAQRYVAMLERINAVGMSAQMIGRIDDSDPNLRNEARARLASALLAMYGADGAKKSIRQARKDLAAETNGTARGH